MNQLILHKEVQDFINKNLKTDITKLVLKGSPFVNVSIQELAEQITSKNKCKTKLPIWFDTKNIYYPNKLNIEQTSSEITANYKANLIKGNSIIDITGGFGVDCFAFSKTFYKVTHCEINTSLSKIVQHNLEQFKTKNITTIIGDGIEFLTNQNKIYDVIYIDPSRRDDLKKRVFLLTDCLPNLPENLTNLFNFSDTILVKTAPLLDINAAINELQFVKEIHVVALNNDVKEVLYLLEKGYLGTINYKTINFTKTQNQLFNFNLKNEEANYLLPKKYLYEPNSAILKAGAFQEISNSFNIDKLHKHSHLYTSDNLINFPGRIFKITQVLPYHLKKIKQLIANQKANITTRNFPETVAQIRKKTKLKDGGDTYLFFTTNINHEKIILVCEKISILYNNINTI
jgi:16S rRNA G966 N2-methylase RsmD